MKLITYVPLVLIIGCGIEASKDSAKDSEKISIASEPTLESMGDPDPLQSLAVTAKDDMPECNNDNLRQLIYVMADKTFFTCQIDGWVSIDIKGEKGDVGEKGERGIKGDPGEDGKVNPEEPYYWIDLVNGNEWFQTGYDDWLSKFCPTGYRLPTITELDEAYTDRIDAKWDNSVWTSEEEDATYAYTYLLGDGTSALLEKANKAYTICLKPAE